MATVIVSAPLPGRFLDQLRALGHHTVLGESPYGMGRANLIDALHGSPEAKAIISLLSDQIDRDVVGAAPNLQVIANYAVGIDNLDLPVLRERGITVTNTPGVLTEATADLAMGLVLDACRRICAGDRLVRGRSWEGWSPTLLLGPSVHGATLGLIGFGRIGQALARRAQGFQMRVMYTQRNRVDRTIEEALGATWQPLDELVEHSDIVSLHCPLTSETRGLMSRERLARMKRGAVLINTARGACVDEEALANMLRAGHLFAAGLDVYEAEPRVHPALLPLPNVTLAPHLGSADFATRERMAQMCVESVIDVLESRVPSNRVL